MNDAPQPDALHVGELRRQLRVLDYQPVAVRNGKKEPLNNGWPTIIGSFPINDGALNTGLNCRGLRVVDIDIDDPEEAARAREIIERHLGARAPARGREGTSRLALIYQAAEEMPPRKLLVNLSTGKVEVLGDGQQLLVDGWLDPMAGKSDRWTRYVWPEISLFDVPRGELPTVTQEQVEAMAAELRATFPLPEPERRQEPPPRPNGPDRGDFPATTFADVEAALEVLPNDADYDQWIRIGMAVYAGCGEAGRELFHLWSSRRRDKYRFRKTDTSYNSFARTRGDVTVATLFGEVRDRGLSWRKPSLERPRPEPRRSEPQPPPEPDEPLPILDLAALQGMAVPARQWFLTDILPLENVGLFTGHGAVGKSLLLLQLAVAGVLGRGWLAHMVEEPGPSLVMCCEDDRNELHRRLDAIARMYDVSFAELAKAGFKVMSFAGRDAILAIPDDKGILRPTPLFERVKAASRDLRPRLVGFDNAVDVYAGNEIAREMVRQFITMLRGLSIEAAAHVMLTMHPSLTGINTDTGLSGSTAWFNSVRAQLYLKPAKIEGTEKDDPELRVLEARKNQYGPLAAFVRVRWRDGVFVVADDHETGFQAVATERRAEEVFMALLAAYTRQGREVGHKPSNAYAPALFAKEPHARGLKSKDLADAMNRLFTAERIRVQGDGPPSKRRERIVEVAR